MFGVKVCYLYSEEDAVFLEKFLESCPLAFHLNHISTVMICYSKSVFVPKYHLADHVKTNEVGRACGTHGSVEKSVRFGGKAQRKETTLKTKA
jgi:hypothetical protein